MNFDQLVLIVKLTGGWWGDTRFGIRLRNVFDLNGLNSPLKMNELNILLIKKK